MFTLEQKVDLILRYIATNDKNKRSELKQAVVKALESDGTVPCGPDIEDMIADLLKEVGMPPHLVGHGYTVCAIKLVVSDQTYLKQITKRLYSDVSAQCGTTPTRAERAIRGAIENVFNRGDIDAIAQIIGNTIHVKKGKLTNGEFIASCANEISRRMKKLGVTV